jgi:2,4-dichlorophenol 6-monooxygenase
VADQLGISMKTVVIGPGRPITDLYFDWAKLRGVEEDGAVLVRPDKRTSAARADRKNREGPERGRRK